MCTVKRVADRTLCVRLSTPVKETPCNTATKTKLKLKDGKLSSAGAAPHLTAPAQSPHDPHHFPGTSLSYSLISSFSKDSDIPSKPLQIFYVVCTQRCISSKPLTSKLPFSLKSFAQNLQTWRVSPCADRKWSTYLGVYLVYVQSNSKSKGKSSKKNGLLKIS